MHVQVMPEVIHRMPLSTAGGPSVRVPRDPQGQTMKRAETRGVRACGNFISTYPDRFGDQLDWCRGTGIGRMKLTSLRSGKRLEIRSAPNISTNVVQVIRSARCNC